MTYSREEAEALSRELEKSTQKEISFALRATSISVAKVGRKQTDEHRENIRKVRTGTHASDEAKANSRAANRRIQNTPEVIEKQRITRAQTVAQRNTYAQVSKSLSKPCTIDDVTIYESKMALKAHLGAGKSGHNNPLLHETDAEPNIFFTTFRCTADGYGIFENPPEMNKKLNRKEVHKLPGFRLLDMTTK